MDATHSVSPSFLRLKHIIGDQNQGPQSSPLFRYQKQLGGMVFKQADTLNQ